MRTFPIADAVDFERSVAVSRWNILCKYSDPPRIHSSIHVNVLMFIYFAACNFCRPPKSTNLIHISRYFRINSRYWHNNLRCFRQKYHFRGDEISISPCKSWYFPSKKRYFASKSGYFQQNSRQRRQKFHPTRNSSHSAPKSTNFIHKSRYFRINSRYQHNNLRYFRPKYHFRGDEISISPCKSRYFDKQRLSMRRRNDVPPPGIAIFP